MHFMFIHMLFLTTKTNKRVLGPWVAHLAHKQMMHWPVAKEIGLKKMFIFLALVAMLFSKGEPFDQF